MKKRLLIGLAVVCMFVCADSMRAGAAGHYSDEVYQNLQRTRDALLGQKDELQRARTDVIGQIERLNAKVTRYDQYLKQVDDSLRDVDSALNNF